MSDATLHAWSAPSATLRPSRFPATLRGSAFLSRRFVRSGLALVALALLLTSVLVIASRRVERLEASAPVVAAPPSPHWIDIVKPVRIYNLEARDLAKLPFNYTARRRSVGNAREDVLTFGTWRSDQPSLRLRILRDGAEATASLDTAIVRQAADIGMAVGHSSLPDLLPTRFGRFQIASVTASDGPVAGPKRQCSGFRLRIANPVLDIDGFACGAANRPLDKASLGCLVDRLDLASAGEDRALIDFFAATDLKRNGQCDGMRLGPDGLHAAWLDTPNTPAPRAPTRPKAHRRH